MEGIWPLARLDKPVLITEDFSWYQRYLPGLFFFLGCGPAPALHSPDFQFDEGVLARGADLFTRIGRNWYDRAQPQSARPGPGGIRRFTTLAKERGDCILLTLGEPEFDTPLPIRQACKDALDQGAPTTRKTGETWPCARPFPNLNAGAGAWITPGGDPHHSGGHGGHLHRPHRGPEPRR